MIDIHSHILPGVDDGAALMDDAIEMARLAVAGGTTTIFATPHVSCARELQRVGEIAGWVASLQAALKDENIPLRLIAGAEVYPMDEVLASVDAGCPLALGPHKKSILLDSPFMALPVEFGRFVFELQTRGYQVIMAHPERVMPVAQHPQMLEELVHRGLLLQLTGSSLLGKNGEQAEEAALMLLRHRWVHFVASDSHSPVHRRPGLSAAARELIDLVGAEYATELLEANGRRVLDGESIPTNPLPFTPKKKRKGLFSWLRRE